MIPNEIPPCTIVIKLGTSSIVHETTHQPLLSTLSAIVETVVELRRHGHKVVLVSSGAIGVGLKRMDIKKKPESLSGKQALAAIGQGRLIALWDNLFGQLQQPIAQVLLTRGDISDRTRYLNAVNTLNELLSLNVVPIVNENDTVSVSEIKFGDNDTLSAITSSMIHADYLFLLTDVDGLYTSNPRKNLDARKIEVVDSISKIRSEVSTTTLGSNLGTGGMETKLIAAEIATAAGVTTVITLSKHPETIFDIIAYDIHVTRKNGSSSSSKPKSIEEYLAQPIPRPPHTVFIASPDPLPDITAWTNHTLAPRGTVVISPSAYRHFSRPESGGRLLANGVTAVIGVFAAGQAVRIAICPGDGGDVRELETRMAALRDKHGSRPLTPTSAAIFLDKKEHAEGAHAHEDEDSPFAVKTLSDGDVVEVGRGLANYNSAQILAVKGLQSSVLPVVLGYADTEYVVENITIRVPPTPPS